MALPAGVRLGPYEIVAPIGAGGMGEVYRARDTRLGRDVAVKVLPPGSMGDANAETRFDREARAIAALNHPNICSLHDVGHHDGRSYLVMELLEGETLHRRLSRGPFGVAALVDVGIALADALDTAHARGVLHRDLKPANIFLTARGQPKLMDFGLARTVDQADAATRPADSPITGAGVTVGTVGYMSPEQLRGEPIDARSDVFSLGVVLYEMATGTRAFEGHTSAVVCAAILGQAPVPPRRLRPELPEKLDEMILKALEKDRDVRCQSAAELRADLKRIARTLAPDALRGAAPAAATPGGGSSSAPPGSAPATDSSGAAPPPSSDRQLVAGLVKRHRLATALVLVAVAGLAAAGVWIARKSSTAPPAAAPAAAGAAPAVEVRRLTMTGKASSGVLSPDGKFVAYLQKDGSEFSVWVMVLATGNVNQIAAPVAGRRYHSLAITPDDSYVDLVARDNTAADWDLWRVPLVGGAPPKRIATGLWSGVGLAPDGRHMAFFRNRGAALVIVDADAANERVLVSAPEHGAFNSRLAGTGALFRPSWSSDGTQLLIAGVTIASVAGRAARVLVIVDAATGAELRSVPLQAPSLSLQQDQVEAAWIDQSRAMVRTMTAGWSRLGLVDLQSGAFTPLTPSLLNLYGISMTADRGIAVSTSNEFRASLWIGSGDGTGLSEVVHDSPSNPGGLSLDNAGNLVYWARTDKGRDVYVLRRGERSPQLLAENGWRADITSDGRVVVFRRDGEKPGLYRVNIDGSGVAALVEGDTGSPSITPDDRTVIYSCGRPGNAGYGICAVPLAGGAPRDLSQRWASGGFSVSPDSRRLLFSGEGKNGRDSTILCDLPDCTNQQEVTLPSTRWLADGRSVGYAKREGPTRACGPSRSPAARRTC